MIFILLVEDYYTNYSGWTDDPKIATAHANQGDWATLIRIEYSSEMLGENQIVSQSEDGITWMTNHPVPKEI